MSVTNQQYSYLINNSFNISKLFHVNEQNDFLLQFLSKKQLDKILLGGKTNVEQIKKLTTLLQYKNDDSLYQTFVDELLKIHRENVKFIAGIIATDCETNSADCRTNCDPVNHELDNKSDEARSAVSRNVEIGILEKNVIKRMKEIICDMQTLSEERQKLDQSKSSCQEVKCIESANEEVMKLKAEIKRLQMENIKIQQENRGCHEKEIICQQLHPGDSIEKAKTLFDEGNGFAKENQSNEALNCYTQALEMRQRLHVGNHADIVGNLITIGHLLNKLMKFNLAIDFFTRAFEMRQNLHGGDNIYSADILINIGNVYFNQKRFDEALNYYEQCLEMRQRLYGPDHASVANILMVIGNVYNNNLNKLAEALDYYTRCLEMRQRLHQGDHVEISATLNTFGHFYYKQIKSSDALKYFTQSLEMHQRIFEDVDDLKTTDYMDNVASSYERMQDWNKALEYFTQSLEMRCRLFPNGHIKIANSLNSVGRVEELLHKYPEALLHYTEAYNMLLKFCDSQNGEVKRTDASMKRVKQLMDNN